uniref:Uncharacterized protein n=1 Tax=Arundo donax TaxID=35708 RepID=A0A0A9BNY6_ARUDO
MPWVSNIVEKPQYYLGVRYCLLPKYLFIFPFSLHIMIYIPMILLSQ